MKNNYLILDIGGSYIKYTLMDINRNVEYKSKVITPHSGIKEFLDTIDMIVNKHKHDICGIAISSAGIIDSERGLMHTGGSLRYISNYNIVEQFSSRYNLPVTIENDAKCAALAEVWCGSLEHHNSGVVFILGTAVGGAIINNRKVISGANFMAGEFSFLVTNCDAPYDGKYNFANTGGVPAMLRAASEKLGLEIDEVSGEKIFELANQGDVDMLTVIQTYARSLAIQINNLQFIIDPEYIAIGGGVSSQPLLIDLIRLELKKINSSYPFDVPLASIGPCKYFNDSNLIGALYVHLLAQKKI